MPIYTYRCPVCGIEKEVFQKVNDPKPLCCKKEMERTISLTSFTLKGGGWYKDGYSSIKKDGK